MSAALLNSGTILSNGNQPRSPPLGRMVPEFSEAANKLKKGTFTKTPVKTQFGYHVIFLEDRKAEGTKKFDEVREQIRQKLNREKFNAFMDEKVATLKKDAKIDLVKIKEKKEEKK